MPFISKILLKPDTRVLALVMFFDHIKKYAKKMFRVLSCVIYTVIRNYVCIDYLGYEKKLIDLRLGVAGSYKHINKRCDNVLGFEIPDILLNLLSCDGFSKNNDSAVILKFPNRIFEYYFNKGFIIFDLDENNLERLQSEVKNRVGAEVIDNSDKRMICSTPIPSTSNSLKNLLVNASSHSSYTKNIQ